MNGAEPIAIEADVLVIGGGMAACWAAIAAAQQGAQVVLVDKGYVGTSGVTATGGPNHWWVAPEPGRREAAIEEKYQKSFGLAERDWMARIIDETWRHLPTLRGYYAFAGDGRGGTFYSGVRGPEYMRALRHFARDAGVTILDHHPALELLLHSDGSVAGAAGQARLARRAWSARAAAVILATGGCAFRSGLIGSHGNTGDGYLMGVEAGASLSGMEFSTAYSLSPAWNSTRTLPYFAARFFDQEGVELDIPPPMSGEGAHLRALARAMLAGPVLADLDDAPPLLKQILRQIQPASPTPFERRGIDLFADRFEISLFGEGTIRGTGGLTLVDGDCQTEVPGLYAAGDAATRELVAGASSGGGAVNSAWALTSGRIAGIAGARRARSDGRRAGDGARATGRVGLRPDAAPHALDLHGALRTVQHRSIGYDDALWRDEAKLRAARDELEPIWRDLADHGHADGLGKVALREHAAMVASARWINAAALGRKESRGMHMRADLPDVVAGFGSRQRVSGLETVASWFESAATPTPAPRMEVAA
jgi:succinate dehydrogenase/fumarate reductase flavoprotein subunit